MSDCRISAASEQGVHLLRLEGDVRLTMCTALDEYCERIFNDLEFASVAVDVTQATGLDSTVLGMLAKLALNTKERFGFKPRLYSTNAGIDRLLQAMGFAQLFELCQSGDDAAAAAEPLPLTPATEAQVREKVIEAHRTLMAMSVENHAAFEDLVRTLEES